MKFDPHSVEQGSAEWLAIRTGRVTASRLNDVMAKLRNGSSAKARSDYMIEKIVERVLGDAAHHFVTPAMQRGIDLEPIARSEYEAKTGELVEIVGCYIHPRIPAFLGSPDGLVGRDGMIEIKTVATRERFVEIILRKDYDGYRNQIQGLLACTGRAWCDLALFDDRFLPKQQLHIFRMERDEERIALIASEVTMFLQELDALTKDAELALAA